MSTSSNSRRASTAARLCSIASSSTSANPEGTRASPVSPVRPTSLKAPCGGDERHGGGERRARRAGQQLTDSEVQKDTHYYTKSSHASLVTETGSTTTVGDEWVGAILVFCFQKECLILACDRCALDKKKKDRVEVAEICDLPGEHIFRKGRAGNWGLLISPTLAASQEAPSGRIC